MRAFVKGLSLVTAIIGLPCCKTLKPQEASAKGLPRAMLATGDEGLSLDQLGAVRKQWLQSVLYAAPEDVPVVPAAGDAMLRFIIALPYQRGDVGHAAIAVDNEFYDFGPLTHYISKSLQLPWDWGNIPLPLSFATGAPWWKHYSRTHWPSPVASDDDITFNAVMRNLKRLAKGQTVIVVPMEVTQEQAANVRQWWLNTYKDPPQYQIPGLHCVSAVIHSLEAADPDQISKLSGTKTWTPELLSPSLFAAKLLDASFLSWNSLLNYRQRAGPNKGAPLKAILVHYGKELYRARFPPPASTTADTLFVPEGSSTTGATGDDTSVEATTESTAPATEPPEATSEPKDEL